MWVLRPADKLGVYVSDGCKRKVYEDACDHDRNDTDDVGERDVIA